jgi:hypothetical protein
VGKRNQETIALGVKLLGFVLSRISLLLGGRNVLGDRDVHAAINYVNYSLAASIECLTLDI